MSFWAGFEKGADVSKAELRAELKKHEDRETPAQEAAESKKEQDIERRAGVEKHPEAGYRAPDEKVSFVRGFEKAAASAVFNIKAKEPAMVMRVQQYLRRLVGSGSRRRRIGKK